MLVMPRVESSVTRGDQMALVSGTPWTKTLVLWDIRREYTYIEDGEVGGMCLEPPAVDGQDGNHSEMSYDSYLS